MTLRSRLVLGLAGVATLLVVPLVLALIALDGVRTSAEALDDREVAAAVYIGRYRDVTAEVREAEKGVLFDPRNRTVWSARMREAGRKLSEVADSLAASDLPRQVAQIRGAAARLESAIPLEIAAAAADRPTVADSIADFGVNPALADAEQALADAERAVRQRAWSTAAEVRNTVRIAHAQALFLLIAGAAGAMAVSIWLTRSVSRPVRELADGMEAVASGRFDHALRLAPARRDEFGALATNFGTMTRRLGELDRLRAEFVSVASHELKTPLNVILGYVALLDEGLYGPITGEQRGVLRTLDGQTRHLTRLVQRLLDVSRFQAGADFIDARPLPLAPFLDDLARAHRVLADQRGLAFTLAASPDLPETVRWDADRMAEVLGNLVSNAVKFTPTGGRVTLTAEPAPEFAAGGRPGPAVRLCVEDTGVGISPEQLPRIFDKFYQASNQARASSAGSGLGLAITKQIVEAHGGVIGAESTPDVGTRFVLLMPADAGAPPAADAPRPPAGLPAAVGESMAVPRVERGAAAEARA